MKTLIILSVFFCSADFSNIPTETSAEVAAIEKAAFPGGEGALQDLYR